MLDRPAFYIWTLAGPVLTGVLVTAALVIPALQENLGAAISRIRDVDVAEESTEFAKFNILVQSGTAMLAQANQTPKAVLSLLQQ